MSNTITSYKPYMSPLFKGGRNRAKMYLSTTQIIFVFFYNKNFAYLIYTPASKNVIKVNDVCGPHNTEYSAFN